MSNQRHLLSAITKVASIATYTTFTTLTTLSMAGCGGSDTPRTPSPTPLPSPAVTANAYILPDAVSKGHFAFGDEPIVIYKGERLRWVNADTVTHVVVADAPDATDFRKTGELTGGGEQSFIMNKPGTTGIHCSLHPNMTGNIIVRDR